MKKVSFLLLFAALTFLFIWSCKKEFSRDESDHSKTKTYSVAALALHQKLLEFKKTLRSDLKSAEVFDLDTAVW